MKKKSFINQLIFSILVTAFALQPLSVSALTVADVKDYYAQFTRGAQCFFQRKKCSAQDQRAWRIGSSGILVAILTIVGYTQKGRIASLIETYSNIQKASKEPQIQLSSKPVRVDARYHPMPIAISNKDVKQVKKLATDPRNLNITYGLVGQFNPLSDAVDFALENPDHEKINESIKIIKVLLDNGARKYDYNDYAQKNISNYNDSIAQLTEAQKNRPSYQSTIKVVQEINKIWK